ncbi:MAG: Arsenical pump-driving ATPase TEMP, partial [uncultured Corynebacteriales bacterium]
EPRHPGHRPGPGRGGAGPGHPDHRLLRQRRGGQDHHRGRAGAAGGRAGPHGGRADHRPGPPAGPVDGADRAGQRPPPGGRRRPGQGRRAARDDAGHEADVRRDRRRALDPGPGRADLREPLLPVAVLVLRRDAGVHGDGEAQPAARAGRVGPDRRGHPAVPVRAGLPGRAAAAGAVPGRADAAAAAGPGPGRRPGLPQGGHGVLLGVHPGADQDHRDRGAERPVGVRGRAGDDVRRVPRAGAEDVRAAEDAGHRVRRGRGAGAGRAARGVVLRRAAVRRVDAAGRHGAQPGALDRGAGAVRRAGRGRRGRAGGVRRARGHGGDAPAARRPVPARRAGPPDARPLRQRAPGGRAGRGARAAHRRPRPRRPAPGGRGTRPL